MLRIMIQGIRDGEYDVDISSPTNEIEGFFPEFVGDVRFVGKLRILGKRYTVVGEAECDAQLVCDLSLEEFTEHIKVNIATSFLANNELYYSIQTLSDELKEAEVHIIHEDEKYLDISDDVRQELAIHLPMRRIAPKYRDKSFDEIYPEYSVENHTKESKTTPELPDERWAPLKKLKLN